MSSSEYPAAWRVVSLRICVASSRERGCIRSGRVECPSRCQLHCILKRGCRLNHRDLPGRRRCLRTWRAECPSGCLRRCILKIGCRLNYKDLTQRRRCRRSERTLSYRHWRSSKKNWTSSEGRAEHHWCASSGMPPELLRPGCGISWSIFVSPNGRRWPNCKDLSHERGCIRSGRVECPSRCQLDCIRKIGCRLSYKGPTQMR